MDFLDFIPTDIFEFIGIIAGLVASVVISFQVNKEWRDKNPSSLSLIFIVGWLLIFLFWLLYGIRFRAIALWLPNCFAVVLQSLLLIAVIKKNPKKDI
ncbi:MAG: hypothetical protein JEZ07_07485 [Phycisphaerae bacterium]|nr:hypothetical protein [Phycisphaerae bacterium]